MYCLKKLIIYKAFFINYKFNFFKIYLKQKQKKLNQGPFSPTVSCFYWVQIQKDPKNTQNFQKKALKYLRPSNVQLLKISTAIAEWNWHRITYTQLSWFLSFVTLNGVIKNKWTIKINLVACILIFIVN